MNETETTSNPNLSAALKYLDYGYSVIAIKPKDKKPFGAWKEFQTRKPTKKEVEQWWAQNPNASVAIVTGAVSGLVVVDVEKGGDISDLPETVKSRTGGDGWHYFYRYDNKKPIKNGTRLRELTDIRGEGGYVVAAPSLHKSGNKYEWSVSPEERELEEFPHEMFKELEKEKQAKKQKVKKKNYKTITEEGERNDTAAQYAGKLLHDIPSDLWEEAGWPALKSWNEEFNQPPLGEDELKTIWESIKKTAKASSEQEDGKKQTDKLMNLIKEAKCEYFYCERKEPHIKVPIKDHWEYFPCCDQDFRLWLGKQYWDTFGSPVSSESVKTVRDTVSSIARFEGDSIALYNRVAWKDETLWYDLGDSEWKAIKVTNEKWEVISNPPILFRHYEHQSPQVIPTVAGGDVKKLLDFVNVTDPDQQMLFLVWVISCFIPDFPHVVASIHGQQGSAKSVISRICRMIIDPSQLLTLNFPTNRKEFVQTLDHHWVLPFDNLSRFPKWGADSVCRAVTGEGDSKRKLFTDNKDIIVSFKRCIILNGINLASEQADLMERTLLFELRKIPKNKRREEKEVMSSFKKALPDILGGIFDTLVKAMKLKPDISLSGLPRMADWTLWGCAVAQALGYDQADFVEAYRKNIEGTNRKVLTENVIADLMMDFMGERNKWEGAPTELYSELETLVESHKINKKELTKSPGWLIRKINTVKPNLEEAGIYITETKSGIRRVTVEKRITDDVLPSTNTSNSLTERDEVMDTNIEDSDQLGGMDDKNQPATMEDFLKF